MPKKPKIRKGALLWWKRTGNSINQNINCPCVVLSVTASEFTVQSLDDFVESDPISLKSATARGEMRSTTIRRVQNFFKEKGANVDARLRAAEQELNEAHEVKKQFYRGKGEVLNFIERNTH